MRKMRQRAGGGPRQKTTDACEETQTEINVAPEAFIVNQNNVLCLPVFSDCQKLVWVHSNQINLQLDSAAELDKAFDRFPYLTQKQTAELAKRYSLHPDQVKVWFMLQRLRYGISWDYKDIQEVQRKFKSCQGEEELQNRIGEVIKLDGREKKKQKREVKESGGKKAGKFREDQNAMEGRMIGENVRANEQLKRKIKQEQPMNKEEDSKVEEDKGNTQKKWETMAVTDKIGKRMKQDNEGNIEGALERSLKAYRELMEVPTDPAMDGSSTVTPQQDTHVKVPRTLPARIRCSTKTKYQLAKMRLAFTHCQYPSSEDYSRLAMLIGIPRKVLVKWFSDMRYYIKKVKPCWMNREHHIEALANIKYWQCLNVLAQAQLSEGSGMATRRMRLRGWKARARMQV